MSNAIIDIGSNSVRMLFKGKKLMNNTQLAEGLMYDKILKQEAISRTFNAVKYFYDYAKSNDAEKVYAFATEAVRSAENGKEFMTLICSIGILGEILTPETEALMGFIGAYDGYGTIAVLDIGGASSELSVGNAEGLTYTHSLPLGSVRLKDYAPDASKQFEYAKKKAKEYGIVPKFNKLIAIGGTLSQLCAVMKELEPYNAEKVHNSLMTKSQVKQTIEKILSVPVEHRSEIKGLHPKKILVAPAGGLLAVAIMEYLEIDELIISERDNLEGYGLIRNIVTN